MKIPAPSERRVAAPVAGEDGGAWRNSASDKADPRFGATIRRHCESDTPGIAADPALHISATVAEATDLKAQYIRTRRQDDEHYRKLILDYLGQWKGAGRDDVHALLLPLLSAALNADQKEHKVHNLLTALRKAGRIERVGPLRRAKWRLAIG